MKTRLQGLGGALLMAVASLAPARKAAAQPPGDGCGNATVIAPPPSSVLGLDLSAGYADDFNPVAGVDGPDAIFALPPGPAGLLRFTTANSTGVNGTVLSVYQGEPCPGTTFITSSSVSGADAALVSFNAVAGQPYYIRLESGTSAQTAGKSMNLYFAAYASAPVGDACSNPIAIASLPYAVSNFDILGFGDDLNVGTANWGADAVWQLPALPAGTIVTADTLGSAFDTKMTILQGASCAGGAVIADDAIGATLTDRATATWTTLAGQSYYVVVEGKGGHVGRVNLKIALGSAGPASRVIGQPLQQLGLGSVAKGEFSPDGQYLVTAGDGGVVLWDVATARRIRTLSNAASDIAYSPDGNYIAFGYGAATTIIEVETGETYRDFESANPDTSLPLGTQRLAFAPDGNQLAVFFDGQPTGMIWNWRTGAFIAHVAQAAPPNSAGVNSVAFSPDSSKVATAHVHTVPTPLPQPTNLKGYAALWNVSDGALVQTYPAMPGPPTPTADMNSIEFSPDGLQLLTASSDATAKLWNVATAAEIRTFAGAVFQADLSPDATQVALANGPSIDIRNASTGALLYQTAPGEVDDARFVRFNPANNTLFLAQPILNKAMLWDFGDQIPALSFLDYPGYTGAMFASTVPSDSKVWTGHASSDANLWDVTTGEVQASITSLPNDAHIVAFSDTLVPTRTTLLWAPQTPVAPFVLTAVDVATEANVHQYTVPTQLQVNSPTSNNISLSADGSRVAAGGLNRVVVWNTASEAVVRDFANIISPVPTPPAQTPDVQLVALSDDGSKAFVYLASGAVANRARVLDVNTGAQIAAFSNIVPSEGADAAYILAADWSPDSTRIVTGDSVGNACVWDAATGAFLHRLPTGYRGNAHPVQYSADNLKILVGGMDGRTHLFDAANAAEQFTMRSPARNSSSHPLSFSYANNDTRVVTGYSDGRTFVWELDPPRALIIAAGDPDPNKNALTVQTKSLAKYAASVCNLRGYKAQDLRILSSFADAPFQASIDYDGDSVDDTYAPTTKANLRSSLIDWMNTSSRFGRRLFLYMTDHGLRESGETHFILNACETISATELDAMLDELQDPAQNGGLHHEVTLVVDCCYSGQFVTACAPTGSQKRTVIASTQATELAVFLPAPDLTSFSSQFLGAAYMGASINGSFAAGKSFFQNFSIANQLPNMVDETGATGVGTAAGFLGESWIYAGSGAGYSVLADLGSVSISPPGILTPGQVVTLAVDVKTADQPISVYAQVVPPAPDTVSNTPVTNLPVLTLAQVPPGSSHWEGAYTVTEDGTYTFAAYGSYAGARKSSAELIYASVNQTNPEESRPLVAVLAAGQEDTVNQTGAIDDQALELTAWAFQTATTRQYPSGQIKVLGPSVLATLGTNLPQAPTYANFASALSTVVSGQPRARLFVSLIGPVDSATDNFLLSPGQTISPAQLDSLLTTLQSTDPTLEVVVLIDCPKAGRYQAAVDKPNRFLALGADAYGAGFFLPGPTYQSFSRRFLEACRQGRDLYDSWSAGVDFASLFSLSAPILTDGSGNPIPTAAANKYLGRRGVFASDAGELATICNSAPDQIPTTLAQAQIYVDFQDGLDPLSVTAQAVIDPPTNLTAAAPTVTLTRSSPTSRRWYLPAAQMASLLTANASWLVSYEASYPTAGLTPRQSQTSVTRLSITDAADIYEPSPYFDTASSTSKNVLTPTLPQNHTLHSIADEDWAILYQLADASPLPFSLHFNLNLPTNAVLSVELYANGPSFAPTQTDTILWTEATHDTQWLGTGNKQIYFRVRLQSGAVAPVLGYRVTFVQNTGANNGIATTFGAQALKSAWSTNSVPAGAQGFNLKRSDTGNAGSFAQVNGAPEGVPPATGACPGPGCADYVDAGLAPLTIYFYQVDVVLANSSTAAWTGTFYGYTNELVATPSPTPTGNAAEVWSDYE